MNLRENIQKILREEYEIPLKVRRRFDKLRSVLRSTLISSYPCEYDDLVDFTNGIIIEVNQYFRWMEDEKEITCEEAELTIRGYLLDDIKEYYLEETINC